MILAIVQARMNSKRLPNKVLAPIEGKPLLAYHVTRLSRSARVDRVVVATSTAPEDEKILSFCADHLGVDCIRGAEFDVLGRFEQAVRDYPDAGYIVRTTADCPLIDPGLVDEAIDHFLARQPGLDYLSLGPDNYPRGLDAEIFRREALLAAAGNATSEYDREHVTPYIYSNPQIFGLGSYAAHGKQPQHRWCVDEPADLELVRHIVKALGAEPATFTWRDCLQLMQDRPEIARLNAAVRQKTRPDPSKSDPV